MVNFRVFNKSFFSNIFLIAVILVLICDSLSWSVIRIGNATIKSFVGLKRTSETNVYLDSSKPASAEVRNLHCGIDVFLPVKQHEFDISYYTEFINYTDNPTKHNSINNSVDLQIKLNFPSGLFLNTKNSYRGNFEPPKSEFVEVVKYNSNTFIGGAGYKFGQKLSGAISFSQLLYDYLQVENKSLNRRENGVDFELSYKIFTKSAILIQYGIGAINYDFTIDNDNAYNHILVGLKGKIAPKTSGELKIGTKDKKYDKITGQDVSTSILSLSTLSDFSEMTTVGLNLNRNFSESSFLNNLYYVSDEFSVNLNQKISKLWILSFNTSYDVNNYPNETNVDNIIQKRQDKNILTGVNLTFNPIRLFFFNCGLTLKKRDSNYSLYSYSDTLTTFGIKLVY